MSAGARIAARYRGNATEYLRVARTQIRNPRCLAAIEIVLTERQEAHQRGYDAAQVLLDAVGGEEAARLHERALTTAQRQADAKQYLEAEQSWGVANALWDYLQERSDT